MVSSLTFSSVSRISLRTDKPDIDPKPFEAVKARLQPGFENTGRVTGGPRPRKGYKKDSVFIGLRPDGEVVVATSSHQLGKKGRVAAAIRNLYGQIKGTKFTMEEGFFKQLPGNTIGVFEVPREVTAPVQMDVFNRDGRHVRSEKISAVTFSDMDPLKIPTGESLASHIDKTPTDVLTWVQATMNNRPSIWHDLKQDFAAWLEGAAAWRQKAEEVRSPASVDSTKKLGS